MDNSVESKPAERTAKFHTSLELIEGKVTGRIKTDFIKDFNKLLTEKVMSEEQAPDFELGKELKSLRGPFIEIAGPTFEGFDIVDFDKLDRPVVISNIQPGLPVYDPDNGQFVTYWGKVDFQADSQKLPIADGKVGAIFGSCLLDDTIPQTLSEAKRVLENGGILVLQKIGQKDFDTIKADNSFSLKYHKETFDNTPTHTVVLKKI